MYVRTKRFTNKDGSVREYLYIVQSVREGGRIVQKTLLNLGRLDERSTRRAAQSIAEGMAAFAEKQTLLHKGRDLISEWSKEYGPALVFRRLWEELGLAGHLRRYAQRHKVSFDVDSAVFAMALHRLCDPGSKRSAYEWKQQVHSEGFEQLELQHLYRSLDVLQEHQKELEDDLALTGRDLFSGDLDLVFYDTTSVSFTGEGCDLTARGHSKEHRPDLPQIVVGMCLRQDGRPVAHHVFRGNTADVVAFNEVIDDLTARFPVRRVIFVVDRGMVSQATLQKLEDKGLSYIVGVRMRRQKLVSEKVLGRAGRYQQVKPNLLVKEVTVADQRYIVCYNPEEEDKAFRDRIETLRSLVEKLKKKGARSLVGNKGYRRFLKVQRGSIGIDVDKIRTELRYDGKYVLRTNTELSARDVALAYRELWRIERAFRSLKSTLEIGPVYHWTESRIRAHVFVCFLALVLDHEFRRRLEEKDQEARSSEILGDLSRLKVTQLGQNENAFLIRTELHGKAHLAFKASGLHVPPRVQEIA